MQRQGGFYLRVQDTIPPRVPPARQSASVVTKWEEPPEKLWFTAREMTARMVK